MPDTLANRVKRAWNAFVSREISNNEPSSGGSYYRPDRSRLTRGNERSIITAIYNRIAMDVADIQIKHVRLDEWDRYIGTIDSHFNDCLSLEANIDQTGRAFLQDLVMSMLDEGVVAVVPTDTTTNPNYAYGAFDILSMRVGKVVAWYPDKVRISVYNENKGRKEEVIFSKRAVAIIENPLFATMNEPNSVMKRLSRKLAMLDAVDEQSSSGKLDLIIQLPYVIKSDARKAQAEERRKDLENQLSGSKYGIAYTDGTEKIQQLNKTLENNLLQQIEYLQELLYSQLGLTQEIMNGTADDYSMTNYYSRTIEPIISAVVDEMTRKFLTKTARSQRQAIKFFRDPFKLVPINQLADLADRMTRNEIMTSNEFRQVIGLKPADDPNADALRNKNISPSDYAMENQQPAFEGQGEMPLEEQPMEQPEMEPAPEAPEEPVDTSW